MDKNTIIIGLTGPIAAGKNALAGILSKSGAFVIDADKIAHKLYPVHSLLWKKIVTKFGSKILVRGGEISRKKLGAIVFSNKDLLQRLDQLVHPYLKEAVINEINKITNDELRMTNCGNLIVINAAVLKEIGLIDIVDQVWVVMASKEKRLKRLIKKGMDRTDALKRMNSQLSQKEYLDMADLVIKNDGTLKELKKRASVEINKINAAV